MSNFYQSREWRELRYKFLRTSSRKCQCCFSTNKPLHVDHIRPVSKFPELKLEINNLQVLCEDCNLGKSNLFFDDFRENFKRKRVKKKITPKGKNINKFMGQKGFLRIKPSGKFHLWDGSDTRCNMYTTGGFKIRKISILVSSLGDDNNVCLNCINN